MENGTSKRRIKSSLSGLLSCAVLFAGSLSASAQQYSFRSYTEGLDNLNISAMAQDQTGYLWVGTESGLYRYNGKEFMHNGTAQGISERTIRNVFVGKDGTVWVATDSNLYFKRSDETFARVNLPVSGAQLFLGIGTTFTSKSANEIFVATQKGAYDLRKTGAEQWEATPLHLDGKTIWSVLATPDGSLWYGCDNDLCRMVDNKSEHVGKAMRLPQDQWLHLLLTRNGRLWIRGVKHIAELKPGSDDFILRDLPADLRDGPAEDMVEDAHGHILVSQGPAFAIWRNSHWRVVDWRNGLPKLDISKLFVDGDGSVWIGVVGHGLILWLGEENWQGFTSNNGLSNDTIWATARDGEGRLWIGTDSGLDYINPNSVKPIAWHPKAGVENHAIALAAAPDGTVWMGSTLGSLTRISAKTLAGTSWKIPNVYQLIVDQRQHLWIATVHGLYVVDLLAKHEHPSLLRDPAIDHPEQRFFNLCMDKQGNVWAAGSHGIYRLNADGWAHIDTGAYAIRPDVIAVDWKGDLWAASPSRNLTVMHVEGNRVTRAHEIGRSSLLSEQVVALMVDHRGWVWVGQDAGVSVFDGHTWRNWTKDDGLLWNDVDSDALMEDKDGSIWIGTTGGLSHLRPWDADIPSRQLPLVFEQVSYDGIPMNSSHRNKWNDGVLSISMASLSFRNSRDTNIRYRLVGENGSGWEVTDEMTVHYRHPNPGNYTFEAVPIDSTGRPVSPVASFAFSIRPRWWQNTLVQITLALLILFLTVVVWRWRIGRLMRQKHELEDAVHKRTKDLEQEKNELVRAREKMRYYAEHDGLTGVWNHRIIVQRLKGEVERSRREGKPLSLILADLDHFKKINDTYGHPAGDETLRHVSTIFQTMVRSYDWVGRYGGEEFLLILPGTNFESARQRAEELRRVLQSSEVKHDSQQIPISASFGVVSGYPEKYEAMIQVADDALYRAKSSGRNCVVASQLDALESSYAPLEKVGK